MALKSSIPLTALAVSKVFLKEVLRSFPEVLTARGERVSSDFVTRITSSGMRGLSRVHSSSHILYDTERYLKRFTNFYNSPS